MTTSSTTIYMGTTLKFYVDQSKTLLKAVKADGSQVNVWGQTVQYAFAPLQTTVTLSFMPASGSDPVSVSYVDGLGTTVVSSQQGGSAVLTIPRPPSTGVTFDIEVNQGSAGLAPVYSASAGAGPVANARMASASPKSPSPSPRPSGPGARLQTRLVLTTVEPPPDPDERHPTPDS